MSETLTRVAASTVIAGNNDRKTFSPEPLNQLAESIRLHGLAQPITLRPCGGGKLEIVAGERRFRAVTEILGWDEVPAIVRDLDDATASAIMLAENTARVNLDPIEEGTAYKARLDTGLTVGQIARDAGVSEDLIGRRVALVALTPVVREWVSKGIVPTGVAEKLTGLSVDRQIAVARAYATHDLTGAQFDVLLSRMREAEADEAQTGLFDMQIEEWAVQAKASRRYGYVGELRVTVKRLVAVLESHTDLSDDDRAAISDARTLLADHSRRG